MNLNVANSLASRRRLRALMMVVVLGGCATATDLEVDVSQDFPSPLVVPAPVHMGIYVSNEFEQYVFQEFEKIPRKPAKQKSKKQKAVKQKPAEQKQSKASTAPSNDAEKNSEETEESSGASTTETTAAAGEGSVATAENTVTAKEPSKEVSKPKVEQRLKMRVALGEAQSRMVRSVLPPVFESATLLESLSVDARPNGMDLYVVPEIKRLQYTTPKSTRTKVYEIWLQYDFVIYDRNDDVVTRWNVPCYGKTPSAMMKSQKGALQAATQMALRDCGAAFATGFSVHPAVERWMKADELRQQGSKGRAEGP
ncbi:MAG: hypothetical protein AB8B48_17580 [Pseudomonadales bacterium]